MPPDKRTPFSDLFMTVWIIIRVGMILIVWLALFLALFLGYFTVPILVVAILSAIYTITDAVFLVANRRQQRKAELERAEMLRERLSVDDEDNPVGPL